MTATLLIPTALRTFTDGESKVSLEGHTVGQLVTALTERFPDIQPHLYDDAGVLRSFINLYVGENNIKTINGLDTAVSNGDEVLLVPAIAGGSGKAV